MLISTKACVLCTDHLCAVCVVQTCGAAANDNLLFTVVSLNLSVPSELLAC